MFTSLGNTSEYEGCSNTSSNVKPSPKNLLEEVVLEELFLIAIGKGRETNVLKKQVVKKETPFYQFIKL